MVSKQVKRPDAMKDVGDYLTPENVKAIFDVAHNHNYRNYLILFLLLRTGRRISELLQLKPQDIDKEQRMILWNILKKKQEYKRWKAVDESTYDKLIQYIDEKEIKPNEYVFYSPYKGRNAHLTRFNVWQFLNKYLKELGIKAHPHTFRHTFAVWIARNMQHPSDLIKLQNLLEHEDVKVTQFYLQFAPEESRNLLESTFN